MAANDNEPDEDEIERGEAPPLNMDRELIDVSAKQLIWAHDNKQTRWVGNKLVKIWMGADGLAQKSASARCARANPTKPMSRTLIARCQTRRRS